MTDAQNIREGFVKVFCDRGSRVVLGSFTCRTEALPSARYVANRRYRGV